MALKEKEREEMGLSDYGIIYLSGVINGKNWNMHCAFHLRADRRTLKHETKINL